MVRRRSRPRQHCELAEGWRPHDGSPCPVDPASKPAILFRMDTRIAAAARRADSYGATGWDHDGGPMDIVGYCPETS